MGIPAASLYNHIRTKQDLLFDLIRVHMENLLAQTDAALAKASAGASFGLKDGSREPYADRPRCPVPSRPFIMYIT